MECKPPLDELIIETAFYNKNNQTCFFIYVFFAESN